MKHYHDKRGGRLGIMSSIAIAVLEKAQSTQIIVVVSGTHARDGVELGRAMVLTFMYMISDDSMTINNT